MIEGIDYFVLWWPFPSMKSEGFVVPNSDGTYTINLNTRYPQEILLRRLDHELTHISENHHQDDRGIAILEAAADGRELIEPEPPRTRRIPVFDSPQSCADWIMSMGR